jgi:hypothetical protein
MGNVTKMKGGQVVRPLPILADLIRKDLVSAEDAANQASMPYREAIAEKLTEARGHFSTYKEFVSWAEANFDIKERTTKRYLSLGKYIENNEGRDRPFETFAGFQRHVGQNPGGVRPSWGGDVREAVAKARAEQLRLEKEHLNQVEEDRAQEKLALRLIDIGFKILSKELHPDKGGSRDAMQRLNRVRDLLKAWTKVLQQRKIKW